MEPNFERDVLPVFLRVINRMVRDPERASIALTLAWYYWQQDNGQNAPQSYAWFASLHALEGRDLPGVQSCKRPDVWDRMTNWGGAGMGNARDPKPGPEQVAIDRESWERLLSLCNDRQREVALLLQGDPTLKDKQLALILGLSRGHVWVMRREMEDLLTQDD